MKNFIISTFIISFALISFIIWQSFDFNQGQVESSTKSSWPVLINEDEQFEISCLSNSQSIEEIFADCQYQVYEEDIVQNLISPKLGIGAYYLVKRATPVYIRDGAQDKVLVRTQLKTVAQLLEERGISIGQDDLLKPEKSRQLSSLMEIEIDRYGTKEVEESEEINYSSLRKPDPNTQIGKTYLGRAGQPGKLTKIYKVHLVNNKEKKRELIEEKVAREPIDEIIYYGTMPRVISTNYGTINYSYIGTCSTRYKTGDRLKITNPRTGKSTIVTVDCGGPSCGPFDGPIIDLEKPAFAQIEDVFRGVIWNAKIEHLAY